MFSVLVFCSPSDVALTVSGSRTETWSRFPEKWGNESLIVKNKENLLASKNMLLDYVISPTEGIYEVVNTIDRTDYLQQ